ncbi:Uncharacterised protein at_DN2433 [Pycnogonum litorale]
MKMAQISYAMKYALAIQVITTLAIFIYVYKHSDYHCQDVNTCGTEFNINTTAISENGINNDGTDQNTLLNYVLRNILRNLKHAKDAPSLGSVIEEVTIVENRLKRIINGMSSGNLKQLHEFQSLLFENDRYSSDNDIDEYVCNEVYDAKKRDYPLFKHGWSTVSCNKSLQAVLSIGLNVLENESTAYINKIILEINRRYPGMRVIIAGITRDKLGKVENSRLKFVHNIDKTSAWRRIMDECQTQFLLVAKNVSLLRLDEANLERLVRQLTQTTLDIAGGSVRDNRGHWSIGCEQIRLKSYVLNYVGGYDYSLHSCVACDVISGPFVVNTNSLNNFDLDKSLINEAQQFEDFFIRRSRILKKSWVCPDSMFFVERNREELISDKSFYREIGKKHDIAEVILSDGTLHYLECRQRQIIKSLLNNPCIQRDLNDAILHVIKSCKMVSILCEISEGTVMGAVKFGKSLPWDVDADIVVNVHGDKVEKFKKALEVNGYVLKRLPEIYMWVLKTKYNRIEMRIKSHNVWLDSYNYKKQGLPPTTVYFYGEWIPSPGNPGRAVRNRYGSEVFRHCEHWSVLKLKHGRASYTSGSFTKCTYPGHHACLDQYPADGVLQFE